MANLARRTFVVTYAVTAFTLELTRLPWWLLKYSLRCGRQSEDWNYRQALTVRLLYSFVRHIAALKPITSMSLDPGAEKERFQVITPIPAVYCKGPLLSNPNVKPTEIGATWYPNPLLPSDIGHATVVLHIHGGAYVLADGRTATSASLVSALLDYTPVTHVLCPQYRLSRLPASDASNPFPAALQDTLSSYYYLVETMRVPPRNIILSGDSAGGHNAIAFLRYLSEFGSELQLPVPSACCLWSPLIQPYLCDDFIRTNPNSITDYVPWPLMEWMAAAYIGLGGLEVLKSPYVSLLHSPFKTEVPIFVNAGGKELLFYDIMKWANLMGKTTGNSITLDVEETAPHDPLVLIHMNFGSEAKKIAQRVRVWLNGVKG
ncbi:alpha/beta-hydrolase [Plenodomus tracheiphilus IPT5]|uniref:Alpha/beta-hydrolase n=1 Tax=Plenodomus tracheiphilus IPT5 TaxID=1408161 RepID=A0A6A7ALG1_9PLEO|nr:alpha/beta-hydrolase [Plenodomus tracheiphilus IPT5]